MNTQPEALRLADALLKAPGSGPVTGYCDDAADELRRLQAENEVLKAQRDELMATKFGQRAVY